MQEKIKRVMIIGKGSLFLGRMTNLFDGVSFLVEANDGNGAETADGIDESRIRELIGETMKEFAAGLLGK